MIKYIGVVLLSFLLFSCSTSRETKDAGLVKLLFYNSLDRKSFSFQVSDKFLRLNPSRTDATYKNITKSELSALKNLLKKNHYCINNDNKLSFEIISRQQQIYDITSADAVEQKHNIAPLTPLTYFGSCL